MIRNEREEWSRALIYSTGTVPLSSIRASGDKIVTSRPPDNLAEVMALIGKIGDCVVAGRTHR
jgi:hypothetical protein